MGPEESNIGRRNFLQMTGAGIVAASTAATATQALASTRAANSEFSAGITPQPSPEFAPDLTAADIMVETLISWGATHCFGVVGDGINSIIEALRKRQDRIKYIGVRHEEAAAFMASGFAKHTGQLGVCVGTTGPGAVHLLNGLYDAHMDGAPVVAITGMTFHDLIGTRYQQGIDTTKLMQDVALYNVEVTGPEHAMLVTNRACRVALGDRGVAHLTMSKDTQMMRLAADKRSMGNPGARTSSSWMPVVNQPPADQLRAAADVLNSGRKVAILVGQGALNAREEVTEVADLLGAPVAKALLGKAVLADDSPLTTGGIGHLGTAPSSWAMKNCDTVFIIGSTMPWFEYYPKPGQARGVQIDMKSDRIGLRYPVEIGLVGDAKATLAALIPLLQRQTDRDFLQEAQSRMADWNRLLAEVESTSRAPLRPQRPRFSTTFRSRSSCSRTTASGRSSSSRPRSATCRLAAISRRSTSSRLPAHAVPKGIAASVQRRYSRRFRRRSVHRGQHSSRQLSMPTRSQPIQTNLESRHCDHPHQDPAIPDRRNAPFTTACAPMRRLRRLCHRLQHRRSTKPPGCN